MNGMFDSSIKLSRFYSSDDFSNGFKNNNDAN